MSGTTDWGRGELKTPTSVEEFIAEIDTDPDLDLTDLELLGQEQDQDLASTDPEKLKITYQGNKRTITSVVKIMRAQGRDDSADMLEDLIQVGKEAQKLVEAVHKKATGTHARPQLRKHP